MVTMGVKFPARGTRKDFWQAKFEATIIRDARNIEALEKGRWSVMVIWECEAIASDLADRLRAFLGPPHGESEADVV